MTFVPGWMWQTMHWLVGIAGREPVLDRVARLVLRDRRVGVASSCRGCRTAAYGPEWTGERSLA